MKRHLAAFILLLIFGIFSLFIRLNDKEKTVIGVFTPTKIAVDLNNNRIADTDEIICIKGIETFSTEVSDEFFNKYSKKFNLTKSDMISLGYLAEDYAGKTLANKKVTVKFTQETTAQCRLAQVYIKGINYKDILKYSTFGIENGEIASADKFRTNLKNARELDLVVLNKYSGRFHTIDCPYGNISHDKIIIPKNQLPADAKPCKFCRAKQEKIHQKYNYKKDKDIFNIPQTIEPPFMISDEDLKIYYTDYTKNLVPNNKCSTTVCKEFVKLVDSTNQSIDIAIYGYDENPAITTALQHAKKRGVKIRFVYDENFDPSKDYYKNNKIITDLSDVYKSDKTGSKTLSGMIMHNKFVIFDDTTVFTGSMNFSGSGLSGYDVNDIVIINSKAAAQLYKKEFEQMLGGKFHTQKEKLNLPNIFQIGSSEVEIYFSPKDKQSSRIIELIKDAKYYIYIPTFLITHTQISEALISAKKRGVDVRVIIDANNTRIKSSKHTLLRNSGVLVKTENYAGKLHSKSMVIDDKYVITGSMNFSNNGENKNDENTLVIKSRKIAKAYKDFFIYLWTLIPNKYLKFNVPAESTESIGSCSDGVDNNFNGKIDKAEPLCN